MTNSVPKIGVLALQGDFDAHRRRLAELGADVVLVRKPEQLDEIDGLVIPGGESSTFLKLLGEKGFQKLSDFVHTKPTFGTCAGAILLAKEVENPHQIDLMSFLAAQAKNPNYLHHGDVVEATVATDDGAIDLGTQRNKVVFR